MLFPLRESTSAAPVEIKSVIFTLEDNRGDRNAIGLALDDVSDKVSFVKRETVHVLSHDYEARHYTWHDPADTVYDAWATDSGLILAFEQNALVRTELVSFEQSEPVFPELKK